MTIYQSNYPVPPLPQSSMFHYLFPQEAGDSPLPFHPPGLPAFIDGISGRELSRAEIEDSALRLITGLRDLGLQRDDVACIWSLNSLEWIQALFGCMAAGLTVSPANQAYAAHEIAHQINNSGSSILFIDPILLPIFEKARPEIKRDFPDDRIVLLVPRDQKPLGTGHKCLSELFGRRGVPERREGVHVHDTATLCYSSGTTGLPKGVMTTHHNLTSQIQAFNVAYEPLDYHKDVILGFVPFSHIYGLSVLMFQVLSKATPVVILPRFDELAALRSIEKYRVTHCLIVPPVIITLVHSQHLDSFDVSSLRSVMSAAAPLSTELAEAFRKRLPGVCITQGYGLTETSPIVTTFTSHDSQGKGGSIGRLLPTFEARLVTPDGGDAARGERGELWVRSPSVMKGYHANQEATAKTMSGEWFKTGDVLVRDDDGWYTVVDRVKELIKFKGFQVPPAEMEGLLLQNPKIADAGVVGVYDASQATELVRAYVVTKNVTLKTAEDEAAFAREISAWVAARVAHYKRLSGGLAIVDAIPKTPSGKILRKDLRVRAQAERDASGHGATAKL
ncbi:hypothetical protein Q8F55_000891 [Vanrija albida]|uniref:AMP-dependent synthetase/ligase domain-containing protein n=1 Tax=Vanrija albida TaxID=181172 RepID=A0ABR3QER9_9TREE